MVSGWVSDPGTLLLASVVSTTAPTTSHTPLYVQHSTLYCTLYGVLCGVCLRAVSLTTNPWIPGSQDVEVLVYGHPQLLPALRVRTTSFPVRATSGAVCLSVY